MNGNLSYLSTGDFLTPRPGNLHQQRAARSHEMKMKRVRVFFFCLRNSACPLLEHSSWHEFRAKREQKRLKRNDNYILGSCFIIQGLPVEIGIIPQRSNVNLSLLLSQSDDSAGFCEIFRALTKSARPDSLFESQ